MRRHSLSGRSRGASGFTLIEILVALALGVLILLALTILFSRNTGNHAELERTTRQLESARYSIDLLSEDLMHAGYFGPFNPNTLPDPPVYQTPDPCATTPTTQGWNTAAAPYQIPVPVEGVAAGTAVGCLANRAGLTEAIVVRHAETGANADIATAATAANASSLYIQVARCATEVPLTPIRVAAGGSGTFTLTRPDCATLNDSVRRLSQRTYYIASCNDCANDTIPTLKRVEFVGGALQTMAVAEGVENLQVEYGIDTNNDGQPDNFLTTAGIAALPAVPGVNRWQNVVTVRIHLLTRSTQPTPGYIDTRTYQLGPAVALAPNDGNKRTLMTTTVRLNNVGGRRE